MVRLHRSIGEHLRMYNIFHLLLTDFGARNISLQPSNGLLRKTKTVLHGPKGQLKDFSCPTLHSKKIVGHVEAIVWKLSIPIPCEFQRHKYLLSKNGSNSEKGDSKQRLCRVYCNTASWQLFSFARRQYTYNFANWKGGVLQICAPINFGCFCLYTERDQFCLKPLKKVNQKNTRMQAKQNYQAHTLTK